MLVSSRPSGTTFRDVTMLLALGFVAMVIWLLPHINPPNEEDDGAPPPGNVIVATMWPEGGVDIDTWVMGPGEIRPVGYSNKSGKLFNLLRDDLGGPDKHRNYENAYSRGIVAGEYIVNVHAYRVSSRYLPITVEVEISINDGKAGKKSLRKLVTTTVELSKRGEEKTAIRFELDADGNLINGSVNSVNRPLRALRHSSGSGLGDRPDYGG